MYKTNLMYSLIFSFWHFYISFKTTNSYTLPYSSSQPSVESYKEPKWRYREQSG